MFKFIRSLTQLFFFIFTILIFQNIISNHNVVEFFNSLHIFTTLSSLSWGLLPPFILVTLFILIHPLLIGRIYCSYLCPVGFLQDLIREVGKNKKKQIKKIKKYPVVYIIFGSCILFLVMRSSWYGLFDHYSNIGRVITVFQFKSNIGFRFFYTFLFLGALLFFSYRYPRWFCSLICPSGFIFIWLRKKAVFDISINELCKKCGICLKDCPVGAISNFHINKEKCNSCFECIDVCPDKAINFNRRLLFSNKKDNRVNNRRELLKKSVSFFSGGLVSFIFSKEYKIKIDYKVITPPGSKAIDKFFEKCTFCSLCVSVCPTNVLVDQNKISEGLKSIGRPKMDYNNAYCSYECNACLAVCPTEAISYFLLKSKQLIKIGISQIDEKTCIPYKDKLDCAACAEHCPTGAVEMRKDEKLNLMAPKVDKEYCIGCGACQYACPVNPIRAIVVKPEQIHTMAYDPRKKKKAASQSAERKIIESQEDFPF